MYKADYDGWIMATKFQDTLRLAEFEVSHLHDLMVNQSYNYFPYSVHLLGVEEIMKQYLWEVVEKKEDILPVLIAALYHDSMEDARQTYNDLKDTFKRVYEMDEEQAHMVVEIVYALTNEKGRTRAERANDRYYRGIRETPYAPIVKMADRIFNMEYSRDHGNASMLEMYDKELPHFLESIEGEDPRCKVPRAMIDRAEGKKEEINPRRLAADVAAAILTRFRDMPVFPIYYTVKATNEVIEDHLRKSVPWEEVWNGLPVHRLTEEEHEWEVNMRIETFRRSKRYDPAGANSAIVIRKVATICDISYNFALSLVTMPLFPGAEFGELVLDYESSGEQAQALELSEQVYVELTRENKTL